MSGRHGPEFAAGIATADGWTNITPDAHGDWLRQRDAGFSNFIPMGDKDGAVASALFANYSNGVKTQRDVWCFNSSTKKTADNIKALIANYEAERARFSAIHPNPPTKQRDEQRWSRSFGQFFRFVRWSVCRG